MREPTVQVLLTRNVLVVIHTCHTFMRTTRALPRSSLTGHKQSSLPGAIRKVHHTLVPMAPAPIDNRAPIFPRCTSLPKQCIAKVELEVHFKHTLTGFGAKGAAKRLGLVRECTDRRVG